MHVCICKLFENKCICKLTQHRLRWFGHVQRRPPEAPVRIGVLERVDNVKRGRGRPKLTCDELVKRDLRDWNISKEIVLDRSAWRLAINVSEPWTFFFRVSSLAYPNLLGKKVYVVVVVSVKHLELSRSWQEQQELAAMTNKKLVSLKKLHHQDDELGQRIDEVDRSRVIYWSI